MATSNSDNFSVSRDDIIEEALMALGIVGEGDAPTSAQLTDHSRTLNAMIKAWQARGTNIWAQADVTVFLQNDKDTYVFGTDHITATSDIVETTLSADAAASATSLTVTSITNLADADYIGIVLDDGDVHWTTINGAPAGSTVVITTGLPSAASSGNLISTYTTKYAPRVLELLNHVRRDDDGNDTPVEVISRDEYKRLSDKDTPGTVNQIYFKNSRDGTPTIYIYPRTSDVKDTLELVVKRAIQDFDAAGDTPDYPQEAYEALWMGLAARLANHYSKSLSERKWLADQAELALLSFEAYDVEHNTSLYLSLDTRES